MGGLVNSSQQGGSRLNVVEQGVLGRCSTGSSLEMACFLATNGNMYKLNGLAFDEQVCRMFESHVVLTTSF